MTCAVVTRIHSIVRRMMLSCELLDCLLVAADTFDLLHVATLQGMRQKSTTNRLNFWEGSRRGAPAQRQVRCGHDSATAGSVWRDMVVARGNL